MKTKQQILSDHVTAVKKVAEDQVAACKNMAEGNDVMATTMLANEIHVYVVTRLVKMGYDPQSLKTLDLVNQSIALAHQFAGMSTKAMDEAEAIGEDRKQFGLDLIQYMQQVIRRG